MSIASIRESLSIITKNILENNLREFYSEVDFFFPLKFLRIAFKNIFLVRE